MASKKIRQHRPSVTVLTKYFAPAFRGGGPIRTLDAMTTIHGHSYEFTVFCTNTDLGGDSTLKIPVDQFVRRGQSQIWYANWSSSLSKFKLMNQLRKTSSDYLYINSLFSQPFSMAPIIIWKLGFIRSKTVIIAPRGELGHGALEIKPRRKRAYLKLTRLLRIYNGVYWHASSANEAAEIREVFPKAKVFVRQNEVLLPPQPIPPKHISEDSRLHAVFIGRLSHKKGVHRLISALQTQTAPILLDVYGDYEDQSYKSQVDHELDRLPPNVTVIFHGALPHENVRQTFASSHVFLFPTAHENFGHTIAESLSASCPVIVGDVTPFTKPVLQGGGAVPRYNTVNEWSTSVGKFAEAGRDEWEKRRLEAGIAYKEWRGSQESCAVFQLVQEAEGKDA